MPMRWRIEALDTATSHFEKTMKLDMHIGDIDAVPTVGSITELESNETCRLNCNASMHLSITSQHLSILGALSGSVLHC